MPAGLNRAKQLILLPCIIVCAGCASVPQTCVQCSLSCDGAPKLKSNESVIVLVEHLSEKVHEEVCTLSSLCERGRCSVPGCFQRDTLYTLKIYTHNNDPVPGVLVDEPNLRPDCGPEGVPVRKYTNGADGKHCNKLLILLAFCFWIVFHLEGPR